MSKDNQFYCTGEVRMETREENQAPVIIGYAAKFDTRSNNLGGFVEVIAKGAFDDVLEDDVRALFNHDRNFVLGRVPAGTLKLSVDNVGLRYEITPPDTQTVRDLVLEPLKRGDITQSSFAFRLPSDGYRWDEGDDGVYVRTITRVSKLLDVSPVTYPAYNDTEASARALNEAKKALKTDSEEQRQLAVAQEQAHRDRLLKTL
ncbi:prohead protease [Shewanella sp. NFH-SH190041]|uniref:HK97 family phage prohead protease n=1 Tax=Shewanella sp. NFH-SH190041 TaxID=2950245 RepID=UPI0021C2CEA0|nr:HK97 family phage prohead protease [Shewanella sp. NFH-SH190041]BDM64546.1 prohead protease [Shewanella sp. NFH-SH190041]